MDKSKITVLIVGGRGSVIGNAIITHLLEDNYHVISTTYSTSPSNQGELYLDITDEQAVATLIDTVDQQYGGIDIVINNAGVLADSLIPLLKTQDWQYVVETNLTGTFYVCKYASRKMIANKRGKVINIASLRGCTGNRGQSNYCAAKAGVISLTKTLAMELAPYQITVNAVCPGFIPSELNQYNVTKLKRAQKESLLDIEHNLSDVVNFITFLCSDKLRSVTGQVFYIDSRIVVLGY